MDEVDFADFSPEKARGMISLEVEKPQMLIGMAQMFVPGMENLELEPGGDPIEVPQELLSFSAEGISVFAAMSNDSIGTDVWSSPSNASLSDDSYARAQCTDGPARLVRRVARECAG